MKSDKFPQTTSLFNPKILKAMKNEELEKWFLKDGLSTKVRNQIKKEVMRRQIRRQKKYKIGRSK